jgi:hypothetical protein
VSAWPVLLLDEQPLVIQPSLIRFVGDHASAVLLQQIHYRSRIGEEHDGHRWAVQSNEQWCEEVVLTKKQLERCLKNLTDLGLLVSEQVMKGVYDRTAWRRINYDAMGAVDHLQKEQSSTTERSNLPLLQEVVEEENTSRAVALDYAFDAFWKQYPRREGKPAAKTAWKRLSNQDRDLAMARIVQWNAYWVSKNEPQFIPYAQKWLNQRHFDASPPQLPQSKKTTGLNGLGLSDEFLDALNRQPVPSRAEQRAARLASEMKELNP